MLQCVDVVGDENIEHLMKAKFPLAHVYLITTRVMPDPDPQKLSLQLQFGVVNQRFT